MTEDDLSPIIPFWLLQDQHGPNSEERRLILEADIIIGVDASTDEHVLLYGQEAIERLADTGIAERSCASGWTIGPTMSIS